MHEMDQIPEQQPKRIYRKRKTSRTREIFQRRSDTVRTEQEKQPSVPPTETRQTPPEQPPGRVEVAPTPDVDPIDWYLEEVARARVARENIDLQRQKVGQLLRNADTDAERRNYEELLNTTSEEDERKFADRVFIDDLISAREQITVWETDPAWTGEKREKAKLVREVIAPTIEYRESWGELLTEKEAEMTAIERGQFETVQKLFEEGRRAAASFKDLIIEERLDGRAVTVGRLRLPNGDDVARLDTVQNETQAVKTQLEQIKQGYVRDFGEPGQQLAEIQISDKPAEHAKQAFRKYFTKAMLFLEERYFPGSIISGLTESTFRHFLQNLDPKLDAEYGDSKWLTTFYSEFETNLPGKLLGSETNKNQIDNIIRLTKTIPGLSEAMNYFTAVDEVRYCRDRTNFIHENIQQPAFWRLLTSQQQARIQRELNWLDERGHQIGETLPNLKQRFEEQIGDDEIKRGRAKLFAERINDITGLSLVNSVYRPDQGPRHDPFLKLFQYDERILVPKKFRNASRVIGTGFAGFFGGRLDGNPGNRPYHFWDQAYSKGLIKDNIGEILKRGEEFNPEDFGLPADFVFNPDQPSWQLPIDWTIVNWSRLSTDIEYEFEYQGEKYEGKTVELAQIFDPWFDDLNDADEVRKIIDKLLDKEVITVEDVQAVKDKDKFKIGYLFFPIARRFERFYMSLANEYSMSVMFQLRQQTGESIFTNEAAAPELRKLILQGAFEKEHFQTYVSFIRGPDGFPKYANLSELVEKPPTLQERALMILNLLGGDVMVDGQLIARGRDLIEAYLNRDEETGEWPGRNNFITFEEFAAYAGLVIENGRLRFAQNNELRNDGTAYLGVDAQGRRLRLRDAARERIETILSQKTRRLSNWMDIQEFILSKGVKLYLGLDFVPGEELERTLQRYYQIIENIVPQLGHMEVGVGLEENIPIRDTGQNLIGGADPLIRILHGNWFEWRQYTTEERVATKRFLPLRLQWDPILTLQEAWIELGPTMLDGRVQEPWTKNPTSQDWREALEQLERPEAYNQIDRRQRELLEIQFNCTQRNVFYQSIMREVNNIPNEKGELVKDKYFEPTRRAIAAILPGPLKLIGGFVVPKIFPPGWETVTQFGLASLGGLIGAVSAGPGGAVLGVMAGWSAGNDWDRRSQWTPAGWGRWLLSRGWARRHTYPGTGIIIGVHDWPYNPSDLAKIFGEKKKNYG